MSDCIFCKIAEKKIPTKAIYEDEDVIAFHDINPAAPVHFLIIPKKHVETLADCSTEHQALLGKIMLLAPQLAKEQGIGYENGSGGFRTQVHTGPNGGQEVYHLHIHVMGGPKPWRVQH